MSTTEKTHEVHVTIHVDGEPYHVNREWMSANDIIALTGLDPASHYLIEKKGKGEDGESYQGRGDEQIHLESGMKFVTLHIGPTPLS